MHVLDLIMKWQQQSLSLDLHRYFGASSLRQESTASFIQAGKYKTVLVSIAQLGSADEQPNHFYARHSKAKALDNCMQKYRFAFISGKLRALL